MALRQVLTVTQTEATYTCRACGLYQLATVSAVGIGTGYLGTAATNAANDADATVTMLLALKRCPRCGMRDERVARRNARTRTLTLGMFVVIALLTAGVVGVVLANSPVLAVSVGGAALLLMAGVGWAQQRMLTMRYPTDAETLIVLRDPPGGAAAPSAPAAEGWKYI